MNADQITIDGENFSVLSQDSYRDVARKFPELAGYWDEQNILARLELVNQAGQTRTGYLFPDGRVQLINPGHPVKYARLGDFYEFAGEDADLAARAAGIHVQKTRGGGKLAGFPVGGSGQYFRRLREQGLEPIEVSGEELLRNPVDPVDQAADLAEQWYGRPAETLTDVRDKVVSPSELTNLARLVELEIIPPGGNGQRVVCLRFEPRENVRLTSSGDGRQLYIVGRVNLTQPVLQKFGLSKNELDKERIALGEIALIAYHAAKHTHHFQPAEYGHKMGEEGGLLPVAVWDRPNKELQIVGGSYQVKNVGLVN